jgi:hypothetical protein
MGGAEDVHSYPRDGSVHRVRRLRPEMENFRDPVVPKKKAKTPAVFFVIPPARLSGKQREAS